MRRLIVGWWIAAVALVAVPLPQMVAAQRTRRPSPPATRPAGNYNPDVVVELEFRDSANKFAENGLPPPEDFGGPPSDRLASMIARKISDPDEDTLPLLITMLQRAGFYIINSDQKAIYQPTTGSGMGLAFYDFEVAGMLKLSRRGIVSSVNKIAAQMGKQTPGLPPAQIAELMVRDLRTAANSANKSVRFWARLIIELGRAMPQPVDLMTGNAADAPLSVIQVSLWERRLIGDLIAFAEKSSAKALPGFRLQPAGVRFLNAGFQPALQPGCQPNDVESLILDASANAMTTAHGLLLEQIAKIVSQGSGEVLGKIATGLGVVNIVLSWAKLVAALTSLKGEITVQQPMPLVRTKNAVEGEMREMKARVWTEVGKLEYLNCIRLGINAATGLDFNLPNNGPLADRDISWELFGDASFSGQGASKSGKFDNFVNLKVPDGVEQRNPTSQITDSNGESRMLLAGAPKIPTVINKPVVPVRKNAGVKIAVAFKSSRDTAQNLIDIGGAALGVALGGPVGILGALPEIGFRTKTDVKKITVPVKDWDLCTSDWAGTVEYLRTLRRTETIKTSYRSGVRTINELTRVEWTLNPRRRDMPADTPPIPADVHVIIENSDIFEGRGEADVCCDDKETRESGARIREAIYFTADNRTKDDLDISLSNMLLLSISPRLSDLNAFKGIRRRSFTVSESACPVDADREAETSREDYGFAILIALNGTKTGRRVTRSEDGVEELYGTETFDGPGGSQVRYTWNLARCGDF